MAAIDGHTFTVIDKAAYLAGPMRGIPLWNFPAFHDATARLRDMGWQILSPAEHDEEMGLDPRDYPNLPDWFTLEGALQWDFQAILAARAIILLPGWEQSSGAAKELRVARETGAKVYEYVDNPAGEPGVVELPLRDVGFETPDGEVRIHDPKTGAAKGSKLARFDLVPADVAWEWAEHYGKGAKKYAERNWEGGYAWSLSYAAAQRHLHQFWAGEDYDEETGSSHLIAALWHCAALRWFQKHERGTDDRS
jgi:hypothetical protein